MLEKYPFFFFYGQFKTSLKVRRSCLVVWQLLATQGSLVMLVALTHNICDMNTCGCLL